MDDFLLSWIKDQEREFDRKTVSIRSQAKIARDAFGRRMRCACILTVSVVLALYIVGVALVCKP